MKKILLVLFFALCLTGCSKEEDKEYPVEYMRYYQETEEEKTGSFTTVTNTTELIEYVFINSDGEYQKYQTLVEHVKISNESKVVYDSWGGPELHLTLEDYTNLLENKE